MSEPSYRHTVNLAWQYARQQQPHADRNAQAKVVEHFLLAIKHWPALEEHLRFENEMAA